MGATNHGTQTITFQYFLEATGAKFGKRLLDVLPPGTYSGGYLTKVTDSEVSLSALVAEIRDANNQISVRTASAATLNSTTLNSGAISSATPYLVLRWVYAPSSANYVDIHALASTGAALENDIIIGKCLFSGSTLTGFDYTDRTFLNIQNLFFKVEVALGLYVRLRAGRIHTSSGFVVVPDQLVGPFSVPSSPNSRIDLVYVDSSGSIQILQGSQGTSPTAPSYGGKTVLAQVTVVNGDTSIPYNRIVDTRSFITAGSSSLYSGGESLTFSNGAVLKQGFNTNVGTTTPVAFNTPFPNGVKTPLITVKDTYSGADFTPVVNNLTVSGFNIFNVNGAGGYDGYYWQVWGW